MFSQAFDESFGDKRLDVRGNSLVRDLFSRGTHSVRQFSQSYADQKGAYRFFENERTTQEAIIQSMSKRCGEAVRGKVVLSIQDTSEINLYKHKNRIRRDESIGVTNAAKNGLGFMLHPSLVVDAASCFPYGYGHVHLFNRALVREPKETRDVHGYKKLGMEQKESNKWLSSCSAVKESLKEAAMVIIVQDREGDIYEQFATVADKKTHLLIRSKSDRTLPAGGKLFNKVRCCKVAGSYSLDIAGDKRKGQRKRIADMAVRFTAVELKKSSRTAPEAAPTVQLWCVEALEKKASAGRGICWRLLTTLPVTTFAEALMIIEWYSYRWMIEEVFRLLKKEGFNVEASELGCGTSVRKLSLLILDAVLKIFQMRIAYERDEEGSLPAGICFEKTEVACLEKQCKRLEGKTQKQKNPYPAKSLRYATWVIARMGGWKGYASERKPGLTTLWVGLKKFYDTFNGFMIAKDMYTP
jgi:hypothetical protein